MGCLMVSSKDLQLRLDLGQSGILIYRKCLDYPQAEKGLILHRELNWCAYQQLIKVLDPRIFIIIG